ncbi:STE3-domain-containing protein [Dichomitus squalens LYAD-421 SS1]|uniref:STE3-domain-containing protein n=1 Tax=Dichomitus squalens (strain LYAD-421) TaxID=732165 RepID=R7SVV3_DICSQ|nr:STE3-domain-containing protein [Dichomitus squalens LYAD-421 SS1]EJF59102.1 STE3-domain-containing protein [Dichomitus squalens LYAD-421 SS1]
MRYPVFPVGAFLAAFLVLIPLPAHWRSHNVATVSIIAWLFAMDVIYGVNTIVWDGNVRKHLLVWCDITTKLTIGASVALPAATMCVCRNLELVASGRIARLTREDKRKKMFFDLAMCYGLPLIIMALHYVVQGHRFDILEYVGCLPATYYSIPGVFIIWFPPLLLSVLTAIYATLALHHFFRQRLTFTMQLKNSNSALSTGRYLRLIAMSVVQIVWQTILTAISMYDNISPGLRPWTNWADVHSDFGRIDAIPMVVYPVSYQRQFFLFLWVMPVSSFVFFFFFGFGEEALKDYKNVVRWIRVKIFRQKLPDPSTPLDSGFARSPKSPLSPIKLSSTFDLSDDYTLPAYSPATDPSFTPFSKDKIGQKITSQSELASPASETFTSRSQYAPSCFSTDSSPFIHISDEYPPPSPPAPVVSLPVPTYHRPFSSPTFYPVPSSLARESDLRVTVETRVEVEHIV